MNELKEWQLIEDYERETDEYRKKIGEEEWQRMQLARLNYFQKRADRLVTILTQKYEATKNKVYLHILQRMGIDVDYSINDY